MNLFLILLFTSIAVVSCKKEKSTQSTPSSATYMTYDIDSVYANGDHSHHVECIANDTTIDIICTENGISLLDLNLRKDVSAGTYPFNSVYAPVLIYSDDFFNDEFHSINGSVTVSEHDTINHIINGSFHATVQQYGTTKTRIISNGQFQGHY